MGCSQHCHHMMLPIFELCFEYCSGTQAGMWAEKAAGLGKSIPAAPRWSGVYMDELITSTAESGTTGVQRERRVSIDFRGNYKSCMQFLHRGFL